MIQLKVYFFFCSFIEDAIRVGENKQSEIFFKMILNKFKKKFFKKLLKKKNEI